MIIQKTIFNQLNHNTTQINQTKEKTNSNYDKMIESLEKTLEEYKEKRTQIQTDTELDPDTKKMQLQVVDDEITNVESQINQIKAQEQEEKMQEQQKNVENQSSSNNLDANLQEGEELRDGVIIAHSLNDVIKFGFSKGKIEELNQIKSDNQYEKLDLKIDPKHPFKNDYIHRRLEQINKAIGKIDGTIANEVRKNAKVSKSTKENVLAQYEREQSIKEDKISHDFDGDTAHKVRNTLDVARENKE